MGVLLSGVAGSASAGGHVGVGFLDGEIGNESGDETFQDDGQTYG